MKNAAVKTLEAQEIPAAANGNSWKPGSNVINLKTVLREWQEGFEDTAPKACNDKA
jgi:hypothetical protein